MVGGDYFARNLDCLALDGRHVSIAFLNGIKGEVDIRQIMQKRLVITGSTLRPRSREEKAELCAGIKDRIWPHVTAGKIRTQIYKRFPLAKAQAAHEALEAGDHFGKIILDIGS